MFGWSVLSFEAHMGKAMALPRGHHGNQKRCVCEVRHEPSITACQITTHSASAPAFPSGVTDAAQPGGPVAATLGLFPLQPFFDEPIDSTPEANCASSRYASEAQPLALSGTSPLCPPGSCPHQGSSIQRCRHLGPAHSLLGEAASSVR